MDILKKCINIFVSANKILMVCLLFLLSSPVFSGGVYDIMSWQENTNERWGYAQARKDRLKRLTETKYHTDMEGNIIEIVQGLGVKKIAFIIEYDEYGREIYNSRDQRVYRYDKDGRIDTVYIGNKTSHRGEIHYTYKGVLLEKIVKIENGAKEERTFVYDGKDRLIEEVLITSENDSVAINFMYAEGRLVKRELEQLNASNERICFFTDTLLYNSRGLVERIDYYRLTKLSEYRCYRIFQYDQFKNIIDNTEYASSGEITEHLAYAYDEKNRKILEDIIVYQYPSVGWLGKTYTFYDDQDRIIKKVNIDESGIVQDVIVTSYEEKRKIDEFYTPYRGKTISKTTLFNSEKLYLNKTTDTEYDNDDRIISIVSRNTDNAIPAEQYYEYNDYENIKKISTVFPDKIEITEIHKEYYP
jgi:hypothetical protein